MYIFDKINKTRIQFLFSFLICLLLLIISYQPSFYAMFRNDDWKYIANGMDLWKNFDLSLYLKRSLYDHIADVEVYHFMVLRNIFHYCKYYFFGNDLFLHHLTSFLTHIINTFLVLILSYQITQNRKTAIISMFLFGTSYLIFDTVSWTGQWNFLYLASFDLGSLILLIIYLTKNQKIFLILSMIMGFIGMNIFEPGIVIPINLSALTYYFLRKQIITKTQFLSVIISSLSLFIVYFLFYYLWSYGKDMPSMHTRLGFYDFRYYVAVFMGFGKMLSSALGQSFNHEILDSYYVTNMRVSLFMIIPFYFVFLIWIGRNNLNKEKTLILILIALGIIPFALISINRYMTDTHLRVYNILYFSPMMPRYYYLGYPFFSIAIGYIFVLATDNFNKLKFITVLFLVLIIFSNLLQIYKGNVFIKKELEPITKMVSALTNLMQREKRDKYILPYGNVAKFSWGFNNGLKYFFFKEPDVLRKIEQSSHPEYAYLNGKFIRIKK